MPNNLKSALSTLRASLAEHRAALLSRLPSQALHEAAAAGRQSLLDELTAEVRRRFGLVLEYQIEAKLAQVLKSVSEVELARWIGRLALLPSDHSEWLSVIETLTVHESFFFRDASQLDHLQALLARDCRSGPPREITLWSAGCSMGEEAYTLAIVACLALIEAGLAGEGPAGQISFRPGWSVRVVGTDISRPALRRAETGFYPVAVPGAFRELYPELLRFFPEAGEGARRVTEEIRKLVSFGQGNLLSSHPHPLGEGQYFDVVCCRNVMIYLEEAGRSTAQSALIEGVRSGGYFLLSPTDTLLHVDFCTPIWDKSSLIYRKGG
jgi:chemotaxis protein methyltransferase CheR